MTGLREVLRSYVVGASVLLPVAIVTMRLSTATPAAADTSIGLAIPYRIGAFDGQDRALRARTLELLETTDVVNRVYATADGAPAITLCVVNSSDNRKIAHPPEVCYTGWGYEVVDRTEARIESDGEVIDAAVLSVRKGSEHEAVLYWYRSGSSASANYYREQLRAALALVTGSPIGSSLVRLTTPEGDGRERARERLRGFATDLLPSLRAIESRESTPSR
ncbi:MAG: EpsI family protein [Planctomycetes bacterium]|nr:EpsI family protein [Planctomycetota bacterium]MBI3845885.1 EpsI family protein [Planctomycetota bacterium]